MKICLFGGTFDPPHIGHLLIAQTVFEAEKFDKVIFVPANKPPNKNAFSPQATRVDVLDRSPFKKGVKRIYEELNIYCQPVALNSGSVWPKNGKLKPNQTLTISILDPISPGMNSDEFTNILQKNIYEEIDKIV